MASAVIAEALLLTDTELYDLEKKNKDFCKEEKKWCTFKKWIMNVS